MSELICHVFVNSSLSARPVYLLIKNKVSGYRYKFSRLFYHYKCFKIGLRDVRQSSKEMGCFQNPVCADLLRICYRRQSNRSAREKAHALYRSRSTIILLDCLPYCCYALLAILYTIGKSAFWTISFFLGI